jgi:methylenetetrahydrofolate--tRNA-(uracil-5-)-methyltransferase
MSAAHHNPNLAEIVCSNSFGSQGGGTASGLLKLEMQALGCQLLALAEEYAVPAGKALAVDRERFSEAVTRRIEAEPLIDWVPEEVVELPTDIEYVLIATGPMTSPGLAETLARLVNRSQLFFFDAASPIVVRDSINFDIAFYQDRYGAEKEEPEAASSYINCPLDKPQYEALVQKILDAEKTPLKEFEEAEKACFFESCLPVEVIASRGPDTLRYGPMKPVGLQDPRCKDERPPYAVVQLRQDNAEGTLYNIVGFQTNIKWGAQKEMIRMIPGLEAAEIVRYGVMHRNTYLHSPEVLLPSLQLKAHPNILIGGQLTGTEGYTESVATGMWAARNIARLLAGEAPLVPPKDTMLGALLHYVTREEAIGRSFQPINSNWGILPEPAQRIKFKALKHHQQAVRALVALQGFMADHGEMIEIPELVAPEANKPKVKAPA